MKQPKTVYGYWSDEAEDFIYDQDVDRCVENGESKRVGVYELVGYAVVDNKTTVCKQSPVKAKR